MDEPTCRGCYAATLSPDELERFNAEAVTTCVYLCPDHQRAMDEAMAKFGPVTFIKRTDRLAEFPTIAPVPPVPDVREAVAAALAEHQWRHTRDTHCACGFRTPLAQLAIEGYIYHIADAVLAVPAIATALGEQSRVEWGVRRTWGDVGSVAELDRRTAEQCAREWPGELVSRDVRYGPWKPVAQDGDQS